MNKKRMAIIIIILILLMIIILRVNSFGSQNVSEVLNLNQKNYKSIQVNDKIVEAGTSQQYLIDDFIPKLGRYDIEKSTERLPFDYTYKVSIKRKEGSIIVLYDNDFIIIDQTKYRIVSGTIDLDKFYKIFIE